VLGSGVVASRDADIETALLGTATSETVENFIAIGANAQLQTTERAFLLALAAADYQATALGTSVVAPLIHEHTAPSAAAIAVVELFDVEMSAEQRAAVLSLDQLEQSERSALTRVLDSYLAYELATRDAFGSTEPDLGPVLGARNELIVAMQIFAGAFGPSAPVESSSASLSPPCPPTAVAPVFAFDLEGCDTTYNDDVALSLDVGGKDTYNNNAGGNGITGGTCLVVGGAAAALLDLTGRDSYASGRSCGANGGAIRGAGLLVDLEGNDVYSAGSEGTNGGSSGGVGLLVDSVGNDDFTAGSSGTNGGANAGAGALIDVAGNDFVTGGNAGSNGGGVGGGVGLSLDFGGRDVFSAGNAGTNGGANTGIGFLLNFQGRDTYTAGTGGTNGGAANGGSGLLFDAFAAEDLLEQLAGLEGGRDIYSAGDFAANGGGNTAGRGALVDTGGRDSYSAGSGGVNGGATLGSGLLADLNGVGDTYADSEGGTGTDNTVVPKGTVGAQLDI